VFVKKQNFITSVITSIQMARFTLPTSSMFVLAVFLLTAGLNYLWTFPRHEYLAAKGNGSRACKHTAAHNVNYSIKIELYSSIRKR